MAQFIFICLRYITSPPSRRWQNSESQVAERKPYSPYQVGTDNKVEYVLARFDDLINWCRKVYSIVLPFLLLFLGSSQSQGGGGCTLIFS